MTKIHRNYGIKIIACFAALLTAFFINTTQAQQSGAGKNLRFIQGFSSDGSVVAIPDSASLDITNAITLEAWVKRDDGTIGSNRIFTKAPEVYTLRVGRCCDQQIQFLLNGQGQGIRQATSSESVAGFAGKWIHIAATWDGNGDKLPRIYINGRETSSYEIQEIVNPPLVNGTTQLWLSLWAETFKGNIDQARIWNVARTPNQIREWMHKTEGLTGETGLVSVWNMNEGTGLTTADLLGLNNGGLFSCDRFSNPSCSNTTNAPMWQNSTAPFGDKGTFVDSNLPTSTGPSGANVTATITSAPNLSNNLGLYQFGSPTGGFMSSGAFDTFPIGIASRSNIVWGVAERGTVTANLTFDYSQVTGVGDPSAIRILRRTDAGDTTWQTISESSRNDAARTITINGITNFEEYALGIALPAPPCLPSSVGLVSWWTLDEPNGTTAFDLRSRNNGAILGTTTVNAVGIVNGAYTFDSSDDGVSAPDNPSLNFGAGVDFTIEAWIKSSATAINRQTIVEKFAGSTGYFFYLNNGNLAFEIYDTGGGAIIIKGGPDLRDGQWHHVALTLDRDSPTGLKFYRDGAQLGTAENLTARQGSLSNTSPFRIGRGASSTDFHIGEIDEVAIYNRALSASDIAAIYNAQQTGKCRTSIIAPSNLTGWWQGEGNPDDFTGANNGTLGTTGFALGKSGQAFNFNGSSDKVTTNLDVQPSAMSSMTFEAWVYPTRINHADRQAIFSVNDGNFDRSLNIEFGSSNFGVFTGGGSWFPTSADLNQWQHVAVVYTPTNIFFYKNGQQFTFGSPPSGDATIHRFTLGANPSGGGSEFYQGRIDEASVYSRALTAGEIQSIYIAGTGGKLKEKNFTAQTSVQIANATINFASVQSGTAQETPLDGTQLPAITGGTPRLYFDVTTDAPSTANATVCFNIASLLANFSNMRVYHLENGTWQNRTAASNTSPNLCTSSLASLSPFAIAQFAPTAATVNIGGRVLMPTGRGLMNAEIILTDSSGNSRSVRSSSFGYYNFEEVVVGETYLLSVTSKRFRFTPRIISVLEEINDLNFIAEP